MSKDLPFQPKGACKDCKFSAPSPKNHWMSKNYPLFCHRLPPAPPSSSLQVWNNEHPVANHDFCAMFEPAVVEPKKKPVVWLDPEYFQVSYLHECEESVVGQCVYTNGDRDCCIFCGYPEERK